MGRLGDYIEEIRQRHSRLSVRKMAMESGVPESTLRRIISDDRWGARPENLKALADRWGTDEDYRELMRLAGHPLPEEPDLPLAQKRHLDWYNELSLDIRRALDWLLNVPDAEEPTLSEMKEAVRFLTGSDHWKHFEIAVDDLRDETES